MKNIYCKCGIYDTQYTLTLHKNGTGTVKSPYIKWCNNTGTLAFEKFKVSGHTLTQIKKFFTAGQLILSANVNCGFMTLDDMLSGYLTDKIILSESPL
jgi:hypothetical protein